MVNIMATMTQGVYILLTVLFTVVAVGLVILLAFFSRNERRRYRENRLLDKDIKTVNLENEIKSMLLKSRASTKFAVVVININDYSIVAAEYGAGGVAAMHDILCRRLMRALHYPSALSTVAKDKIAVIIKANVARAKLDKLIAEISERFSVAIAMPAGREIKISTNCAAVYYPNIGEDFTQVITGLEFALAESRRKGAGVAVVLDSPIADVDSYDYGTYKGLNKAVNSRAITMQYRRVVAVEESTLLAIDSSLFFRGKDIDAEKELYHKAQKTGDLVWLDMLNYRKVLMQLAPIVCKSNKAVSIIYALSLPFLAINGNINNLVLAASTYDVEPSNIMVEIDYKSASEYDIEQLHTIASTLKAAQFKLIVGGICDAVTSSVLAAIMPNYAMVDADKLLSLGGDSHAVAETMATINSLEIVPIAYNVDNSRLYDELTARSIEYCMGEFSTPIMPLSKILEDIK